MVTRPSTSIVLDILAKNRVRATVTFAPLGATIPDDPTSVAFKTMAGDGTTVTYTYGVSAAVIRDSVGVYHLDFVPATAGRWWVQSASNPRG